ncbi:MAG: OmpA family protein [Paracoccaceae bacterium]
MNTSNETQEEQVVVIIDEDEEEEHKCPPVGSPIWMATFADMICILVAIFVLILTFADFDVPKFKQLTGSLRMSFGVQREAVVLEQPKGTTVIEVNFSPSPVAAIIDEITQETTIENLDEIERESEDKDADQGEALDTGGQMEGNEYSDKGSQSNSKIVAERLASALEGAVKAGEIELKTKGNEVVVQSTAQQNVENAQSVSLYDLMRETLTQMGNTEINENQNADDVVNNLQQQLKDILVTVGKQRTEIKELNQNLYGNDGDADDKAKAAIAKDVLEAALRQEINSGLVTVSQRADNVIITVGSGGAFPSGTADLTDQAKEIIERIAFNALTGSSKLTVTGHTDNVPINGGLYRDNWDLAAARAASVVQTVQATGIVPPQNLEAVSKGENQPIASNDNASGRERNRRIEIEINY